MMLNKFRMVWFIFCLYVRQSLYHKSAAIGIALTWVVRIGLTILLYRQIYALTGKTDVRGISLPVAISGMCYFAVFLSFGFRELARIINRENRTGNLEIWFMKPLPYLYLKISESFGTAIMAGLFLLILSTLYGVIHLPALSTNAVVLRFLAAFLLLLQGLVIATLLYCLIGLSALFLGNIRAIENVISKMVMIFGGAYVPIGFFPDGLRTFGELLPMTAMMYGGQFLYPDFFEDLPRFIFLQLLWVLILSIALLKLNRMAHRQLTINGG